jgi:hypothetical protein
MKNPTGRSSLSRSAHFDGVRSIVAGWDRAAGISSQPHGHVNPGEQRSSIDKLWRRLLHWCRWGRVAKVVEIVGDGIS